MEAMNPYSKLQDSSPYKHYWFRHSMITPLGKKITIGWSCPLCHRKVDETFPYCPYCGKPMYDPNKED